MVIVSRLSAGSQITRHIFASTHARGKTTAEKQVDKLINTMHARMQGPVLSADQQIEAEMSKRQSALRTSPLPKTAKAVLNAEASTVGTHITPPRGRTVGK